MKKVNWTKKGSFVTLLFIFGSTNQYKLEIIKRQVCLNWTGFSVNPVRFSGINAGANSMGRPWPSGHNVTRDLSRVHQTHNTNVVLRGQTSPCDTTAPVWSTVFLKCWIVLRNYIIRPRVELDLSGKATYFTHIIIRRWICEYLWTEFMSTPRSVWANRLYAACA